jgi:hypothetical protein
MLTIKLPIPRMKELSNNHHQTNSWHNLTEYEQFQLNLGSFSSLLCTIYTIAMVFTSKHDIKHTNSKLYGDTDNNLVCLVKPKNSSLGKKWGLWFSYSLSKHWAPSLFTKNYLVFFPGFGFFHQQPQKIFRYSVVLSYSQICFIFPMWIFLIESVANVLNKLGSHHFNKNICIFRLHLKILTSRYAGSISPYHNNDHRSHIDHLWDEFYTL